MTILTASVLDREVACEREVMDVCFRNCVPGGSASGQSTHDDGERPVSTTADYNDFNTNLINEFRANGGKVSGVFANSPLMLLTTTGAKSGKQRTSPLVHTTDGDRLVIIASKGGADTHPDWYHNLLGNPMATVELPGETFTVRARVAEGEEHDRLYAAQAALMPNFAEYQRNTSRKIPVVVLERVA
jgi:deazaflavin-dependent oxidoreductase (nitroreductase family)